MCLYNRNVAPGGDECLLHDSGYTWIQKGQEVVTVSERRYVSGEYELLEGSHTWVEEDHGLYIGQDELYGTSFLYETP